MTERTRPSGMIRAVVKSNTVDVAIINGEWPRALLVGTAGTATITDGSGTTLTDVPLQVGYNPISVQRVWNSGTASNIWALY